MYKHLDKIVLNEEFRVNIPQEELPEPRRVELVRYLTAVTKAPPLPPNWDWHWVVRKGKYAGTMPKRISSFYHKEHELDLDPKLLEWIGNFAKKNSSPAQDYYFDVTDRILWEAGQYGDSGSCYWGSNRLAKDVLSEHGALAVRFYWPPDKSGWRGRARCWMAVDKPQGFVLFNAYDNKAGGRSDKAPTDSHPVELFTMARVLGTHLGLSYKRIGLTNNGDSSGLVYINSGGYLVGEIKDIESVEALDLKWPKPRVVCSECGRTTSLEEISHILRDSKPLCTNCVAEKYRYCGVCRMQLPLEMFNGVVKNQLCRACEETYYAKCTLCDRLQNMGEMNRFYDVEGPVCRRCFEYKGTICERCDGRRHDADLPCRCMQLHPINIGKPGVDSLEMCHDCHLPILGTVYKKNNNNLCHICARVVCEIVIEEKHENENEET